MRECERNRKCKNYVYAQSYTIVSWDRARKLCHGVNF